MLLVLKFKTVFPAGPFKSVGNHHQQVQLTTGASNFKNQIKNAVTAG